MRLICYNQSIANCLITRKDIQSYFDPYNRVKGQNERKREFKP